MIKAQRRLHLVSFIIIILIASLLNLTFVLAAHETDVTIDPSSASCGDLSQTYTVTIENLNLTNSTDNIREVRIYDDSDLNGSRDPGIVDFQCGAAPSGWSLEDKLASFNYCQYETTVVSPDRIMPGDSLDFTFNATLDDTNAQCGNLFRVASIDDATPIGEV